MGLQMMGLRKQVDTKTYIDIGRRADWENEVCRVGQNRMVHTLPVRVTKAEIEVSATCPTMDGERELLRADLGTSSALSRPSGFFVCDCGVARSRVRGQNFLLLAASNGDCCCQMTHLG